MAVAGAGRDVEIHRRRGLRRLGGGGSCYCIMRSGGGWRQASYCVASASVVSLDVVVDCRPRGRGVVPVYFAFSPCGTSRALFSRRSAPGPRSGTERALILRLHRLVGSVTHPVYRTGSRYGLTNDPPAPEYLPSLESVHEEIFPKVQNRRVRGRRAGRAVKHLRLSQSCRRWRPIPPGRRIAGLRPAAASRRRSIWSGSRRLRR